MKEISEFHSVLPRPVSSLTRSGVRTFRLGRVGAYGCNPVLRTAFGGVALTREDHLAIRRLEDEHQLLIAFRLQKALS